MKTSFFFSNKILITDNLVSVAGLAPKQFKDQFPGYTVYKPLVPPKQLVLDYKSNKINKLEYSRVYREQLNKLDPFKVYDDLKDSIILCWEVPEDFCHRHLIARWIRGNTGEEVLEL